MVGISAGGNLPDLAIHAARGLIDGNYLILVALLASARSFLVLVAQPCAWFCPEGTAVEAPRRPFAMTARPSEADPCVLVLKLISDSWEAWGWFSCSWFLSLVLSSSGRHQCWNALSGVHQRLQNLRIDSNRWPAGQCRVLLHSSTHICWKVQLILRCHKD